MVNLSFREWLAVERWRVFLEALQQWDSLDAMKAQNNPQISSVVGMQRDWISYIISIITKTNCCAGVRGGDILAVATKTVNHLIMTLGKPGDQLTQQIQQIKADPDPRNRENRIMALLKKAIYVRARRHSEEFQTLAAQRSVHQSTLEKDDVEAQPFRVGASQSQGSDYSDLKQSVIDELRRMAEEAKSRKETKLARRYELGVKVAEIRMGSGDEFVSMNDLVQQTGLKPGQINLILKDIQQAALRAAQRHGFGELEAGAQRRMRRTGTE